MPDLTDAEYLRARYGAKTMDRRTIWIVASVLAVVAAIWIIWQVTALGRPTASAEPVALNIVSDSQIEVTYNLTAPIGSTVTCTVTAYSDSFTEVGVRQVTVGPTDRETTAVTTSLATIQLASGADVNGCFFAE
ncbi:MAG TPA: DUF4307 domain-containing protein [Actinomycetaceae bacterium]|nr:DUF4307 domain-containing protein [Actinomycetaceae bacterium]